MHHQSYIFKLLKAWGEEPATQTNPTVITKYIPFYKCMANIIEIKNGKLEIQNLDLWQKIFKLNSSRCEHKKCIRSLIKTYDDKLKQNK